MLLQEYPLTVDKSAKDIPPTSVTTYLESSVNEPLSDPEGVDVCDFAFKKAWYSVSVCAVISVL